MGYLDALGQKVERKNQTVGEFRETSIGQPSEVKKKSQAMYDKLSPEEKRIVDRMVLKNRKGSEQSKNVQAQEKRTDTNLRLMSKQETAQRVAKEQATYKANQANVKATEKRIKAEEKIEKDNATRQAKVQKSYVQFENSLLDINEADEIFEESLNDPLEKEKFLDNNMVGPANDFFAWEEEKKRRRAIHDRKQRNELAKLVNLLLLSNGGDEDAVAEILKKNGIAKRFQPAE